MTQGVNTNALSHICVVYNNSQEIKVNGGVHHRSALSTPLIILIIWCREIIDSRLESAIKVEVTCIPLAEAVKWQSVLMIKRPARHSGSYCQS